MADSEDGNNHSTSVLAAGDLCRQGVPLEQATIATVKSILFCHSRRSEDTWNVGYPVPEERPRGFVLLASTLPTLKFELIMITKDAGSQIPVHEVVQSYNFPSSNFFMSVFVFSETRTLVFIKDPRKPRCKSAYCRWAISIGAVQMQYSKDFWGWACENFRHLDATALSYVNLERPKIAVEENRMKLRSGRLLGEYTNGGKAISYSIPGVSHQWEFTCHVARQSFQAALGHVFDQSIGPTDIEDGKTRAELNEQRQLEYRTKKKKRNQVEQEVAATRVIARKERKAKKSARNWANKQGKKALEHRDPDADYEPSSPLR